MLANTSQWKANLNFLHMQNIATIKRIKQYKLFANIIRNRLNEHMEDEMVEEQCGFRKGRSCIDAIFTVQQIMEKKERTQPTAVSFIYRL